MTLKRLSPQLLWDRKRDHEAAWRHLRIAAPQLSLLQQQKTFQAVKLFSCGKLS